MAISDLISKALLLGLISVDFGMMLDPPYNYEYTTQNEIRDIQLVCLDDKFQIRFETANSAFNQNGRVFVKGRSADKSCSAPLIPNTTTQLLNITLSTCGMERSGLRGQQNGAQFTLIVIVTFHQYFVTKNDRAFRLTCVYGHNGQLGATQLGGSLDVSMLPTTVVERNFGTPDCSYSLHSGTEFGPIVRYAQVGVKVVHLWNCRNLPAVDGVLADHFLFIHDCFVISERGVSVPIIDDNGCSKDKIAMSSLNYTSNSQVLGVHTAYHFADEMSLHYRCEISICRRNPQTCRIATIPPNCQTSDSTPNFNYGQPPSISPPGNLEFFRDFQSPQQFVPVPRYYGREKRSKFVPEWSFDVNTEPIAVLNLNETTPFSVGETDKFGLMEQTNNEIATSENVICFSSLSLNVSLSCFGFLFCLTIVLFIFVLMKRGTKSHDNQK